MGNSDFPRAVKAVADLELKGANGEIAAHWLSLWQDDRPPELARFDSPEISKHQPAMMICEIAKGESLRCISGGAIVQVALGFDISNQDLLSLTPVSERDLRLSYWWLVVEGAVSVTYRKFTSHDGAIGMFQGVALPFSDETEDGHRFFLMHTNWRPEGPDKVAGNVRVDFQTTSERRMVRFRGVNPRLETKGTST